MSHEVSFGAWRAGELAAGTHLGTAAGPGGVRLDTPVGRRRYADPYAPAGSGPRDYEWAAWVSPEVTTPHPFTSLVPSWNARTPGDGWLEVEARVRAEGGWSTWWGLGCWSEDQEVRSASRAGQRDEDAFVRHDVLWAARPDLAWTGYQLRVTLYRRPGIAGTVPAPSVSLVGAVVAGGLAGESGPEPGGKAHGVELAVPAYSQHRHQGTYPEWNGGGEAWCAPTSTSMVLRYWGLGPGEADYTWVDPAAPDRFVPHAARHVFDHAYRGAGNWAFNAAYAARWGAEAFVTRLRSMAEAEAFVAAGIPLVASVAFAEGDVRGAGYGTAGHLLTIVGFDADGHVVCNDPASHQRPSNDAVRVVYDRGELERAWQAGSGGLVYVVRPGGVPLPDPVPGRPANW